jgi:outer membrane protein, multidrug efflux system
MKYSRWIYFLVVIFSGLLWVSCKVIQPYERLDDPPGNLYRGVATADTNTIAYLRWNEVFTDTALQRLIAEGIRRNPNLQIALTRIEQAEAYYHQSRASFFPSLDANAGVSTSKLSEAQGFGIRTRATQYQLGLTSSWEADIWGRLRSNRRANLANLLQSECAMNL